jgi:hypothetical protein
MKLSFCAGWVLLAGICLPAIPLSAADAPAFRILYIGDSITRHEPNPALKWDHTAGMAASDEAHDYAHRLGALIQSALPGRKVEVLFPAPPPNQAELIQQLGVSSAAEKDALLKASPSPHPDLVIVQLGEHEKKEKGAEALRASYDRLLSTLESWSPRPRIICTGVWCPLPPLKTTPMNYYGWPLTIEQTMAGVCRKHHVDFVSVQDIAMNPACHGWGEVKGVQWHPNDLGHAAYASHLFAAFQKNPAPGH